MNGLSRRRFVQGAGVLGAGLLAGCGRWPRQAPQPAHVSQLGFLAMGSPERPDEVIESFRQGMRDLGHVEEKTVVFAYRWAAGDVDRLPALADDLVQAQVDVIVATGTSHSHAAKSATGTIPIVMLGTANPVAEGLIASLARPGGNVTGMSLTAGAGLHGKRLELLQAVVPRLARVAVLWDPAEAGLTENIANTEDAARALDLEILPVPVPAASELDSAFDVIMRARAEALYGFGAMVVRHATRIAAFAIEKQLPSMAARADIARAGLLLSYAPNFNDLARRAAGHVDKILKGAKPADLPVEQPREFDFIINLKTARTLGLTIPHHILLQATEVIE